MVHQARGLKPAFLLICPSRETRLSSFVDAVVRFPLAGSKKSPENRFWASPHGKRVPRRRGANAPLRVVILLITQIPPKEPRLPEPSPRSQPGFDRRYGHAYMPGQLEMRAMRWQHARCDRRAVLRSDPQIAFRRRAFPYISACSRLSTLPRHATLHVNRAPASGCMHCGRNRGCA